MDLIEVFLGADPDLAIVAAGSAMSPSTLSRFVKSAAGRSVRSHVLERRLMRAAEMSRATDVPIAGVALGRGFSSQSYLTTVFRTKSRARHCIAFERADGREAGNEAELAREVARLAGGV